MSSHAYNTDCLDFLAGYSGEPIKLIVTDPPYLIPSMKGAGFFRKERRENWQREIAGEHLVESYDIPAFARMAKEAQGGAINAYFFCNKKQIPEYLDTYVRVHKCKFDILCWHKPNAMPTFFGKYLTDTEYILYFRNKGGCHPHSYADAKTFFLENINQKDKKRWRHPTIKPLDIVRTLIRNSSDPGDIVFDGFLGSGTTRVAAHQEGRRFIGCEIDPVYFAIQEERFACETTGNLFSL